MIESLHAIRSLGLAPVFENLYFGRAVPANLDIYMRYPTIFHTTTLAQCGPLTDGGLVPLVGSGNGDRVCLFDPRRNAFVVKVVEEPRQVVREFASWQQHLAYVLLEIAESGPDEQELVAAAQTMGFTHADELLELLRQMESLPDSAIDERCERFIDECA